MSTFETETARNSSHRSVLQPTLGHCRALDGLRGVAVLVVVAGHAAGGTFPGGGLGVDIFFVLSGFLITRLLVEERRDTGDISLKYFYARRSLRLLPALLVVLAFVAFASRLCVQLGLVSADIIVARDIYGPLLYIQNWLYINHHDEFSLMSHTWSLAVEEQFYLLWPMVLLAIFRRRASARSVARALVGAVVVALVVMVTRALAGVNTVALSAGLESRGAVMLLSGAAIAFWFEHADIRTAKASRWARRLWPLAVAVLAGLILTLQQLSRPYYLGGWMVVAAAVGTLLVAALNEGAVLARLLDLQPLRWFGTISYGLYLWHVPLLLLGSATLKPRGYGSATVAAIGVSAAIALAAASFYFLERPLSRRGRARLSGKQPSKRNSTSGRLTPGRQRREMPNVEDGGLRLPQG